MTAPTRVLLVGIDGVRPDALEQAQTPNLDALAARGGQQPMRIDERGVTISGPMWTTILTGTWPREHAVTNNDEEPAERIPDVFTSLRRAGLASVPVAAASWPPLTSRVDCGPIVNPAEVRAFTAPLVREDTADYITGDEAVKGAAMTFLEVPAVDAAFVYFGLVDEVGHSNGVGDVYREAIERVDGQLGEVLDVLDARPDRDEWAVLVTTDHGHTDAGSHGGTSPEECDIWVISDSSELLGLVDGPDSIAPAITRVYERG